MRASRRVDGDSPGRPSSFASHAPSRRPRRSPRCWSRPVRRRAHLAIARETLEDHFIRLTAALSDERRPSKEQSRRHERAAAPPSRPSGSRRAGHACRGWCRRLLARSRSWSACSWSSSRTPSAPVASACSARRPSWPRGRPTGRHAWRSSAGRRDRRRDPVRLPLCLALRPRVRGSNRARSPR